MTTVNSPLLSFCFVQDALTKLDTGGLDIVDLVTDRHVTTSSCFTGIGGDLVCNDLVHGGIARYLRYNRSDLPSNRLAMTLSSLWTCEKSPKCQEEIFAQPPHMQPLHVFGDIREFVPKHLRKNIGLDNGTELDARDLKAILPWATMRTSAWCYKHGKTCTLERSDFHSSSPPCTDDSRSGRRGGEDGVNRKHFYIFVGMRRTLRENFVRCENVDEFGVSELNELLGDLYVIVKVRTEAHDYGYCTNRLRQDVHLILKTFAFKVLHDHHHDETPTSSNVAWLYDAENTIKQVFHRRCNYKWNALFMATDYEVNTELEWSRSRRGVQARLLHKETDPFNDEPHSFLESITLQERTTLQTVWEMYPNDVVDTKNNPSARIVKSNAYGLPTLVKGQGLLFSPCPDPQGRRRFFTLSELYEAYGYPISASAQGISGSTCAISRGATIACGRTRASGRSQLGNGWHVGAFAANALFILLKLPLGETRMRTRAVAAPTPPALEPIPLPQLPQQLGPSQPVEPLEPEHEKRGRAVVAASSAASSISMAPTTPTPPPQPTTTQRSQGAQTLKRQLDGNTYDINRESCDSHSYPLTSGNVRLQESFKRVRHLHRVLSGASDVSSSTLE